jgi:hypothetical protein
MNTEKKLFAFKLAEEQVSTNQNSGTWKIRDGVAIAGCSSKPPSALPYLPSGAIEDSNIIC